MRTWNMLLITAALSLGSAAVVLASTCANCTNQCCSLTCGRNASCTSQCIACQNNASCFGVCKDNCSSVCTPVKIVGSGIAPDVSRSANGRQLVVTGHVNCTEGGSINVLRVTVTEREGGATAEGLATSGQCTGDEEPFSVTVQTHGAEAFLPGPGEACALLVVDEDGTQSSAHQWCADVTIE